MCAMKNDKTISSYDVANITGKSHKYILSNIRKRIQESGLVRLCYKAREIPNGGVKKEPFLY